MKLKKKLISVVYETLSRKYFKFLITPRRRQMQFFSIEIKLNGIDASHRF